MTTVSDELPQDAPQPPDVGMHIDRPIELPMPERDDFYYDDASEPGEMACERCRSDGMDPECDYLLPCPACQGGATATTAGIQQARDDLAKWGAHVAADQTALRDYQQAAATVWAHLEVAKRTVANLREVVDRWDCMPARHEPFNEKLTGIAHTEQR